MAYSLRIPGGILSCVETEVRCPSCGAVYSESWYYKALSNSKTGVIYKSCKGCKAKLGISTNLKSDVVVWLKEDEKK